MRWKDIIGDHFNEDADAQIKAADAAVERAKKEKKRAEVNKLRDKLALKQRELFSVEGRP